MKTLLLTLAAIVCSATMSAQNTGTTQQRMRIDYKDKSHIEIPISDIDSISFVNAQTDEPTQIASLVGQSWFWGKKEAGYYELLTFNADHSYTGYDFYFDYGFDTSAYGTYTYVGSMLNLRTYGIGYNHIYRWFVTALTDNALDVMTSMGRFVYYRVQPEPLRMRVGGTLVAADGDQFVFADGVYVDIVGNQLRAKAAGTTYIQKSFGDTGQTWSYKVIIE